MPFSAISHNTPMDTTYYPVALLSCLFFLATYFYISPTLSNLYFPVYSTLSIYKKVEWHTRMKSTIHAIIVSVLCMYIAIYDNRVSLDPVWGKSPLVKLTCAIVVGYMTSDSIVMLMNYRTLGSIFFLFHHGASIYAYYFVMTYGVLPWFANFRLIAEFSTPLVNQRWFLGAIGYHKKSPLFIANGIAMAVMFFIVRIACIPPYWYKVYTIYGTESCLRLGGIWYVLLSTCIVLDVINAYWFYKIFEGARKIIANYLSTKPSECKD